MKLSVIIPCYNHGHYIQEALDSVFECKDESVEVIIIDDGSTDPFTINKIDELIADGYQVIRHQNSGLAHSRNVGISHAKGEYILPLDADNKITVTYIKKGIALLANNQCDIVYAKPLFFGENIKEREFHVKPFDGIDLLFGNYIDACAIFRKKVWEINGGYDENMPFPGHEDWDFWIKSFLSKFQFHFLDEALYGYRIDSASMINNFSSVMHKENHNYIWLKYKEPIIENLNQLNSYKHFFLNDQKNYLRTSVKYLIKFFKGYD